jgi:hypothetical protein
MFVGCGVQNHNEIIVYITHSLVVERSDIKNINVNISFAANWHTTFILVG